jgi:hypothetical protein
MSNHAHHRPSRETLARNHAMGRVPKRQRYPVSPTLLSWNSRGRRHNLVERTPQAAAEFRDLLLRHGTAEIVRLVAHDGSPVRPVEPIPVTPEPYLIEASRKLNGKFEAEPGHELPDDIATAFAKYQAAIDSMTPEERARYDAAVEEADIELSDELPTPVIEQFIDELLADVPDGDIKDTLRERFLVDPEGGTTRLARALGIDPSTDEVEIPALTVEQIDTAHAAFSPVVVLDGQAMHDAIEEFYVGTDEPIQVVYATPEQSEAIAEAWEPLDITRPEPKQTNVERRESERRAELDELTVPELRKLARSFDPPVKGARIMGRDSLVHAILVAENIIF